MGFFGQLGQDGIFLKRPSDKILEGHFINVIPHYSVQSIPAQDKTDHIFVSFDGILSHSIVIKWLLTEGIAFCESSLEAGSFEDWGVAFFDVVEGGTGITFLDDGLSFVELLAD